MPEFTSGANFQSQRNWWSGTILSASQLGVEFSDAVRECEVQDLLDGADPGTASDQLQELSAISALLRVATGCFGPFASSWRGSTQALLVAVGEAQCLEADQCALLAACNDREEEEEVEDMPNAVPQTARKQSRVTATEAATSGGSEFSRRVWSDLLLLLSAAPGGQATESDSLDPSQDFTSITSHHPFMPAKYFSTSDVPSSARQPCVFLELGGGLLDILRCQVLVQLHLCGSQDSLFIAKAVQMLAENALHHQSPSGRQSALRCLKLLQQAGLNIERAIRIASDLAKNDVGTQCAPTLVFRTREDIEWVPPSVNELFEPAP